MPKFSEAYPEQLIKPDKYGHVRTETASGRRMDKKVDELINRLNKLGFARVTVVNVNPFPVRIDLGYNGTFMVKGCKEGEPYVAYQIKKPLFHPIEKPEADRDVDAIMPIEQAQEFVNVMRTTFFADKCEDTEENGRIENASIGVFWYNSLDDKFPQDLYDRARFLQGKWFEVLFEEAENLWGKSHNRREINERMKDAARYMKNIGAIRELPEWISAKANVQGPDVEKKPTLMDCPICGETVGVNAALCPKCQTMFKPDIVKELRPDIYFAQRPHEVAKPAATPLAKPKTEEKKDEHKGQ